MLTDTGADISLIKLSVLNDETLIGDNVVVNLQGISDQTIKTVGRTVLTLHIGNLVKEYYFHVVPKDFMLRADGVIGRDLLVNLKANIDYGDRMIKVGLNKIPMCDPEVKIDAKAETIVQVIVDRNGEGLIEEMELESGLFIPNTVVKAVNHKAKLVVVNTTNQELTVPQVHCTLINYSVSKVETQDLKVSDHLRLDKLTHEETILIRDLCDEYRDIFFLKGDKLTATNTLTHEIPLQVNTPPIHVKPYRLPDAHQAEVSKQIEQMLENGTVRPSISPFNAPLLVIPKKLDNSGIKKYRLAVDFRKLNDVTIGEFSVLPNIVDILDRMGNSKYFTTLDLASGFHQINIKEEDKHKTAFSTSNSHLEFNRMPFGLKNAPATFQRLRIPYWTG